MLKSFISLRIKPLAFICLLSITNFNIAYGQRNNMELPKEKQTTLGLYATAKEAYEQWKAAPEKINILDVRTLDEYINIGHAEMAWNIPAFFKPINGIKKNSIF